jgi:hypothetical protein
MQACCVASYDFLLQAVQHLQGPEPQELSTGHILKLLTQIWAGLESAYYSKCQSLVSNLHFVLWLYRGCA